MLDGETDGQSSLFKEPASTFEPVTFRRSGSRKVYRESAERTAAQVIGSLTDGDDICGLTNGQFSLIDIVSHVLSQTGPADVTIATWTMGVYDAEIAYSFVRDSRIKSMRFLLDPSMFSRRPELASVLVAGFGSESFRAVDSHAKFATIRGDNLAVTVRSSMNLNRNTRLESFDLTCCNEMTAFFEAVVNRVWSRVDEENRHRKVFDALREAKPLKDPRRRNPFSGD
jgi:hypothetical protein